jgi:glycerophosphoryl diester phosphodiesterase
MWPYPRIIAHRGGGSLAPENTMAALRCGLAYGFRAVEFDVMLAQDGVPVVVHDPELGRTVAGQGRVSERRADELALLDAGAWFDASFAGETVPPFSQFLEYCRSQRIWMNIEIKPAPGFEAETGAVVARATREFFSSDIEAGASKEHLPLLSSFSATALAAAREAAPGLPVALLVDAIPADWQARTRKLGAVALHVNQKKLDRDTAQAVRQAGLGLFCYTVNEPQRARELLGWGVDAFCTDRIDLIHPTFS